MRGILFTAIVLVLGSLALTVFMTWRVWAGIQTNSWIKTEGILQQVTSENVAGESRLTVQYAYVADGHSFNGSIISFRMWDVPSASVLQSQQGHELAVFYDPRSPNHAVLFQGIGFLDVIFALTPFLVTCAFGFVIFMFVRGGKFRLPLNK